MDSADAISLTIPPQIGPEMCRPTRVQGEDPRVIRTHLDTFFDDFVEQPLSVSRAVRPGSLTSTRAQSTFSCTCDPVKI